MQFFDNQTIKDLEFDQIRGLIASGCIQPSAQNRATQLIPYSHLDKLMVDLKRLNEFVRIKTENLSFPSLHFFELEEELSLLRVGGSVLNEESFSRIHKASVLVNQLHDAFAGIENVFVALHELLASTEKTTVIIQAIEKVFDLKWQVKDGASTELLIIRQSIAEVRRQVSRNFAKALKECSAKGLLGDTNETYINDRKALAINSTHKRKVPGIVLGQSKTGALTYIEPGTNIQLNIDLENLKDDERTEIRKILKQLTDEIRIQLPWLKRANDLLIEFDFVQAKSKLAIEINAVLPEISTETIINLKDAYHPLLLINNKKSGRKTLPQTLCLNKFSRMLVISGPNAGGKSITMKTIGLLQLMLQSGLLVPVDAGSQMSIFQSVHTDIGDNQSIENQLSTYSYRLKRMKGFLQNANRKSLVLLDEFGTGSDPELGGALAEVFFEELYSKKCFGVITTHYTNIKLKAAELQNACNGCMLFNRATLEPTYKLSIGEPGSSFTFEVAEINGIDTELIRKAKAKLSDKSILLDKMLGSLQEEKTKLEDLSEQAMNAALHASNTISEFEKKREKLEEKINKQQETIERNNKYLTLGKKMNTFIETYKLREKNKDILEEVKKFIAVEKTKIENERKERTIKKKIETKEREEHTSKRNVQSIKKGSLVRLQNTKQTGTVMELEKGQAVVAFGVFKTKVEVTKLEWIK